MDSPEVISIVKNIIKTQKKFNYDSLPNISYYVDCIDKKNITPLHFYCKKKDEFKCLEILQYPNICIYEKKHPLEEATYRRLKKVSLKMIELNMIPQDESILEETFLNCLNHEMEDIALALFNHMNIKEMLKNGLASCNPIYLATKYNLNKVMVEIIKRIKIRDISFYYDDLFEYAKKNNNILLISFLQQNIKQN